MRLPLWPPWLSPPPIIRFSCLQDVKPIRRRQIISALHSPSRNYEGENLKEIAATTSQENEFEKIATSAASIVQTCEEIENIVAPRNCCSCS